MPVHTMRQSAKALKLSAWVREVFAEQVERDPGYTAYDCRWCGVPCLGKDPELVKVKLCPKCAVSSAPVPAGAPVEWECQITNRSGDVIATNWFTTWDFCEADRQAEEWAHRIGLGGWPRDVYVVTTVPATPEEKAAALAEAPLPPCARCTEPVEHPDGNTLCDQCQTASDRALARMEAL